MKKYLSIAFTIMLLIVSCKPSVEEQIKGSWEYSQRIVGEHFESSVSGETEFKEDGKYIDKFISVGITAYPTVNGEKVRMCLLGYGKNEGTWRILEGEKNQLLIPNQYYIHFFSCKIYDIKSNDLLEDIPQSEIESTIPEAILMTLKTDPFFRDKQIIKSIQKNKMIIKAVDIYDKPLTIEYTRKEKSDDSDTNN